LFKIVRSRVLKLLCLAVYFLEHPDDSELNPNREQEPLYEFIQNHRRSLEVLVLPLPTFHFGEPTNPNELGNITTAVNLKRICLTTVGEEQNNLSKYWINLLLQQESLENLSIRMKQTSDEIPFPWLASLLSNNARTLTDIDLSLQVVESVDNTDFQGNLDMCVFLVATSLRRLEVCGYGFGKLKIRSLNEVSGLKSLIRLKLDGVQILPIH